MAAGSDREHAEGPDDSGMRALLARCVDDRDSLDDAEWETLLAALGQSPRLAQELKDQLVLDELLRQRNGVDRRNFLAQVEQRIVDVERGDDELLEQIVELREFASDELREQGRPRRSRRRWLAVAASLAALIAGWWLLPGWLDQPEVTRVFGPCLVQRGVERLRLVAPFRLRPGDELTTSTEGFVALRYRDGTELQLGAGVGVALTGRPWEGKTLRLDRGALGASVARQSRWRPLRVLTPQARATVLGTELLVDVSDAETRLDVAEGRVELTRAALDAPRSLGGRAELGEQSVVVEAHQSGVADGAGIQVRAIAWPSRRDDLHVLFDPFAADDSSLPASVRGRSTPRGNARVEPTQLVLAGGALLLPQGLAESLTESCRESRELTIEIALRSDSLAQSGPARIVSLSADQFNRSFTLGQEGGHYLLRLRTPRTGANGNQPEQRLGRLEDRGVHHLVVTYDPGRVDCYWDGVHVLQSTDIQGDFSNWRQQYLLLGDEWDSPEPYPWRGEIHALAIYSRRLEADEALRNAAALRGLRD